MTSPTSTADSRVWFVTGSSSGLGKALVEEILAANERVVATLRKPEALSSLSEKYPASQLLVLPLDVTNQAQITDALEKTKKHFGRLDVVVNNAGYGIQSEVEGTSEAAARALLEVLFWGPFHIMKQAVAFMRDVNPSGQGGRILNISSTGGYISFPTSAVYSAGKFALEGLTEGLAKEMLPSWNIKAIIIEPGGFSTEFTSGSMIRVPVHPKYDNPTAPSVLYRQMLEQPFIGDPAKAAKALMHIASMADPPTRVQLGTDSLLAVRHQASQTIRDGERFADLAHSTNLDGVDKDKVWEMFAQAAAK